MSGTNTDEDEYLLCQYLKYIRSWAANEILMFSNSTTYGLIKFSKEYSHRLTPMIIYDLLMLGALNQCTVIHLALDMKNPW